MTEITGISISKQQKKPVIINFLGSFSIQADDKEIDDNCNRSQKMWSLLEYLIFYHKKNISHQQLIDILWPDGDVKQPVNALKALLHRMRNLLAEYGVDETKKFIISGQGFYGWNNGLDFQIDTDLFEGYCRQGDSASDENEKIDFYKKAIAIYKDDFLKNSVSESWVMPLNIYYRNMFVASAKNLLRLLMSHGDYMEVEKVAIKAIGIEALDEDLHKYKIMAFLGSGNMREALKHYDYVSNLFFNELGIDLSDDFKTVYAQLMKTEEYMETDLQIVKRHLQEEEAIEGAFVCDYGFFRKIYQLEARAAIRKGQSVFIGLLTITDDKNQKIDIKDTAYIMDRILFIINKSLRKGDVVARFSSCQYVLMLSSLTYENGIMVMERIVRNFYQNNKNVKARLYYKLQPLDPVKE